MASSPSAPVKAPLVIITGSIQWNESLWNLGSPTMTNASKELTITAEKQAPEPPFSSPTLIATGFITSVSSKTVVVKRPHGGGIMTQTFCTAQYEISFSAAVPEDIFVNLALGSAFPIALLTVPSEADFSLDPIPNKTETFTSNWTIQVNA